MNMMHPETGKLEVRNLAVLGELDATDRAAIEALPPLISTDSHVMEPQALWQVAAPYRETVHEWLSGFGFSADIMPAGAGDPHARLLDQKRDGIQAEILFPNDGMAFSA